MNKQLREEADKDKEVLRILRTEKQNAEDSLWKERNSRKMLDHEVQDLRAKLKELITKNSELLQLNNKLEMDRPEKERLIQIEVDYQRSQQQVRDLQSDIRSSNARWQDIESKYITEQEKCSQFEKDCVRYQAYCKELQIEVRSLKTRISDQDVQIEKQRTEISRHNEMIMQYDTNLGELESQFERREIENEGLMQQIKMLKEQITMERENNAKFSLLNDQVEEEVNKRKSAEKEVERLRNELESINANFFQDQENMKRAIEDIRYQNEENIRIIHLKEEEVRFLQKDLLSWKEVVDKGSDEVAQLKSIIAELEEKNRKLNEKLNEVIYNKASAYKQRTLQALRRGDSPERREKIDSYGLPNMSEKRLDQAIQEEHINPDRGITRNQSPKKNLYPDSNDPTSNYKVYHELERIENSNYKQRHHNVSPMENMGSTNEMMGYSSGGYDEREGLRREDLSSSEGRVGANGNHNKSGRLNKMNESFTGTNYGNQSSIPHGRSGSTNANTSYHQQSSSPLRQKINIATTLNNFQLKPQTPQKPFYSALQSHQDRVKYSCEKLASALGIHSNEDFKQGIQSNDYQLQASMSQPRYLSNAAGGMKQGGEFDSGRRTEDNTQMTGNATAMTSTMIKKSLQDLRAKLENMKKDNQIVESGISEFESKNLGLTYQGIRCSGGGHHEAHHYHYDQSQQAQSQFKIPTQEDLDYQLPKKGIINEKFHRWVAGRWPVDRDDILQNDKVNKYSAYYWLSSTPVLQTSFFVKLVRFFFDNQRIHEKCHYDSFRGVKSHENAQFLYKSNQADSLVRSRMMDYTFILGGAAWIAGYAQFMFVPLVIATFSFPRKLAVLHYFTFHAELLPHTEQVVFHKVSLFGNIRRIYVDIKNLEKIDASVLDNPFLWQINMFDQKLVFRDMESKEIFVFDRYGIWNEDTLKHKLLY